MKTVTGTVQIGDGDGEGNGERDGSPDFESLEAFLSRLQSLGEDHDVLIQAFDARYVAGEAHLEAALEHAKRAMERGENVADDLAVETLCYAAGRRQIDEAMTMGVKRGEQSVVVLIDGEAAEAATESVRELLRPETVAADEDLLMEYFGITPAEREITTGDLSGLVRERVALLDVEK